MLLGMISPEIYGGICQTFDISASKDVISPEITGRTDHMFENSSSKDVISPENKWKNRSYI
jgi:hypothetical protein